MSRADLARIINEMAFKLTLRHLLPAKRTPCNDNERSAT